MARFIIKNASSIDNEDNVIHVATRWLEFITEGKATDKVKPDVAERRKQAVDLTFYIKKQKYALEHTCIEAFPGEFTSDGMWGGRFGLKLHELETELNNYLSLPYDLKLIIPNRLAVNRKNLPAFLGQVKEWVISVSSQLSETFPDNTTFARVNLESRTFRLKLSRDRSRSTGEVDKGQFRCLRMAESDEAHDRRIIVEKAFRSKANKLSAHKEKGSKSVLVLEWRFRIPTPYSPIIYAHRMLKEAYQNAIDMVILVGTEEKEWSIKYTVPGLEISDRELMKIWWLYNWEDDTVRRYIWL